jgi:hypothetical protein
MFGRIKACIPTDFADLNWGNVIRLILESFE